MRCFVYQASTVGVPSTVGPVRLMRLGEVGDRKISVPTTWTTQNSVLKEDFTTFPVMSLPELLRPCLRLR